MCIRDRYSNTALVTPKSSEASADNARVPVGVRRTLSLAGDRSVTTGGASGIELMTTSRSNDRSVNRTAIGLVPATRRIDHPSSRVFAASDSAFMCATTPDALPCPVKVTMLPAIGRISIGSSMLDDWLCVYAGGSMRATNGDSRLRAASREAIPRIESPGRGDRTVSYTHLTLPTSDL